MAEHINYHESVIIPTLQKKISELQNSNLVFEVSLLVEQAKMRDLNTKIRDDLESVSKLKDEIESKVSRITSLKTELGQANDENTELHRQLNDLQTKYSREISIKDNILGEYRVLKSKYDLLEIECNGLKAQNEEMRLEIEALKTPINKKKQQ